MPVGVAASIAHVETRLLGELLCVEISRGPVSQVAPCFVSVRSSPHRTPDGSQGGRPTGSPAKAARTDVRDARVRPPRCHGVPVASVEQFVRPMSHRIERLYVGSDGGASATEEQEAGNKPGA